MHTTGLSRAKIKFSLTALQRTGFKCCSKFDSAADDYHKVTRWRLRNSIMGCFETDHAQAQDFQLVCLCSGLRRGVLKMS